jgi:hypothetical protein
LRYFDLKEVIEFIMHIEKNDYIPRNMKISRRFAGLDDITMEKIKLHYLEILKNVIRGTWGGIYINLKYNREKRILPNDKVDCSGKLIRKTTSIGPGATLLTQFGGGDLSRRQTIQIENSSSKKDSDDGNCAIYVTTKDSYTLTDGPTIFLATNVDKIAKFCIQQANIPSAVMDDIMQKIEFNNTLNKKIGKLENDLADIMEKGVKDDGKDKKKSDKCDKGDKCKKGSAGDNETDTVGTHKIRSELEMLQSMIKNAK